jgi:hypothetical protein
MMMIAAQQNENTPPAEPGANGKMKSFGVFPLALPRLG